MIVDPKVEEYAEAHSTPDGELFERLAAETREKTTAPQIPRINALMFPSEATKPS